MFYCDDCADNKGYPETMFRSRGTCEICGNSAVCNERKSIQLPSSQVEVDHVGVHVTHCCSQHGCKYGDADCPVELGSLKQAYDCEQCEIDKEEENQKWTPIEQALPKTLIVCLVTVYKDTWKKGHVRLCYYDPALGFFNDNNLDFSCVTAWQPVPEPYVKGV